MTLGELIANYELFHYEGASHNEAHSVTSAHPKPLAAGVSRPAATTFGGYRTICRGAQLIEPIAHQVLARRTRFPVPSEGFKNPK